MLPHQRRLPTCPPFPTCPHLCAVGVPGQPSPGEKSADVAERSGLDLASLNAANPELTYSIAGIELHGRFRLAVREGVLVLSSEAVARLLVQHGINLDPTAP